MLARDAAEKRGGLHLAIARRGLASRRTDAAESLLVPMEKKRHVLIGRNPSHRPGLILPRAFDEKDQTERSQDSRAREWATAPRPLLLQGP
jgi:hypothetical protein